MLQRPKRRKYAARTLPLVLPFVSFLIGLGGCNPFVGMWLTEAERTYFEETDRELGVSLWSLPKSYLQRQNGSSLSETFRECRRAWNEPVAFVERALYNSKNRPVPALYSQFNVYVVNYWTGILPVLQDSQAIAEGVCTRLEDLARRDQVNDTTLATTLSSLDPELQIHYQRAEAVEATFRFAMDREQIRMNEIYSQRGPAWLPQRGEITVEPAVHVSLRPYLIPVTISLSSELEVSVVAEVNVPTPIGIVSAGGGASLSRSRTLTVRYRGKDHVYSLEEKPFVFKVEKYQGTVLIEFSEKQDVLIELR